MKNIILCGGSGTRLWPISSSLMPKQFVKLFSNKSLFQLTIERNSKVCKEQFIVSNSEQYFLAYDQLEELNKLNNKYLLEPLGRNTAPAIALSCLALDEKEYQKVIKRAKDLALEDNLVTFGITPTFAETGYGYIEAGGEDVKVFYEKPDLDKAENGNYIAIDSSNNLVHENERKIATVDIDDTIIVDTGDALLISKKGSSQKIKRLLQN